VKKPNKVFNRIAKSAHCQSVNKALDADVRYLPFAVIDSPQMNGWIVWKSGHSGAAPIF